MWINPTNQQVFATHSEVRAAFPNVSMPANLTEEIIDSLGFAPIAQAAPGHNPDTHAATESAPELVGGQWVQQWVITPLSAEVIAANLAAVRAALLLKIDADTDSIYRAVQGDRAPEYLRAEKDALDYMTAGYTGPVPTSVSSWALAKDQTNTWACDDILSTATAWRGAQEAIRSNRLLRKEQARVATDLAPVAAAWAGFVAYVRQQLGVPG